MSTPIRVLIVEDSEDDALLILRTLAKGGYEPAHERVETAAAMEAALNAQEWDIVLSDYTMPWFSAPAALKILQEREIDIPFLIVSGSIGEETAVAAMKAGAHDYVMKDKVARLVPAVERELSDAGFRRAHNDALRKMCEQAALLDISTSAFIVRDKEDRIVFWSKGAEQMYGWTAKEVVGKAFGSLLGRAIHPENEEFRAALTEKGAWSGECRHWTREGKQIVVESNWLLMEGNNEKPATTLVVNTDVTDKKALEAQYLRSQRMESIGALASGIAHDMNNILSPISMAVDMLKQTLSDESSRRILNILEKSADRGAALARQILSFVRGLEGERAPLHARELFAETEMILRATIPKSIDLRIDAPKNLAPVSGNCTQLIQVLLNLCVNARDAMPSGGTLGLSARSATVGEGSLPENPKAPPGDYIVLTVSDTGAGIPAEIRERIFDPFFTTKGPGKGTGLGLSTVTSIVKGHCGFLTVSSRPGEGARFEVYLPASSGSEEKPIKKEELLPIRGHVELVLVIDDEVSILEMVRATLDTYGYRVITATNGAEGLAAYRQHRGEVKAVILDMRMPVMGGPATIKALRDFDPHVKIILSSGEGTRDADLKDIAHDIQAVLPKPFSIESLLSTLHDVVGQPL